MSFSNNPNAKDLNRRILEKIATDPQFREQMLDNPEETIINSEFGEEIKQLAPQRSALPQPQDGGDFECWWTCWDTID